MPKLRDTKTQKNITMSLQDAIMQLHKRTEYYPAEAINVVLNNADEAKPYLYEAIDKAIAKGEAVDTDDQLCFYSLFILGEFADTAAFERIVSLVTLPPEAVDDLLGDLMTGGLDNILYCTFNGDFELLKASAKDCKVDDFVRSDMLRVLAQLYIDGKWSRESLQGFLKEIVYGPQKSGDYIYIEVQSIILHCHFREMLREMRFMCDAGILDTSANGDYAASIDWMYSYDPQEPLCQAPVQTESLRRWAMFKDNGPESDEQFVEALDKMFADIDKDFPSAEPAIKVKVGRNDPCPCGSGKKYKFCCMNKKNEAEQEVETEAVRRYWLKRYPETGVTKLEGRIYLDDFYDEESIAIDKLIYLALFHRAVPIWRREEESVVIKRQKWYLGQALDLFMVKMAKEGYRSLLEYDEKCSIHYLCREWMEAYQKLLEDEKDSVHYSVLRKYL